MKFSLPIHHLSALGDCDGSMATLYAGFHQVQMAIHDRLVYPVRCVAKATIPCTGFQSPRIAAKNSYKVD